MNKEAKKLMKRAKELGYEFVRITSNGHSLVRHKVTGFSTTIPSTPNGGKRSYENCLSTLIGGTKPGAHH